MLVRAIILIVLCSTLIECNIGVSPCPIFNNNGTVHSGKKYFDVGTIMIAGNGIVPLVPGQDSQCYNYSLPYAFLSIPEVAVGNSFITQLCMILKVIPAITSSTISNHCKLAVLLSCLL